jgi:hypothetical protein
VLGSAPLATLVLRFVADRVGLRPAVLAAAVVVIAGVGASLVWRLPETGHIDPQPAAYWATYRVAVEPIRIGPVRVAVHFTVAAERQPAF